LLHTVERIYIWICTIVFIIVFILAGAISSNFLKAQNFSKFDLTNFVCLMGLAAVIQMLTSLYNGGLTGLQRQVLTNTLSISYSLVRSLLGLIIVFIIPNLYSYFIWNVFCNIAYLFVSRYFLRKSINLNQKPKFELHIFKNIWRFASGMMVMTFIAVANTQIDKLVVGKILSLKEFAYYSIGSLLAQIPLFLTMPMVVAILPKMTRLAEEKNTEDLRKMYHNYSFIISTVSCSVGIILFLYTRNLVSLWVGSQEITNNINIVSKTLVVGGMFLTLQFMPYYLAIANGHNKTNIKLGITGLFFVIPSVYICIERFGLNGAGIPWGILNFSLFIILGIKLTNKFCMGDTYSWFLYDVFLPLTITVIIGISIYLIGLEYENSYIIIAKSLSTVIFSILLSLRIYNKVYNKYRLDIRNIIKNNIKLIIGIFF
jgi:O-antigen/teichoic acid export membrane protein